MKYNMSQSLELVTSNFLQLLRFSDETMKGIISSLTRTLAYNLRD